MVNTPLDMKYVHKRARYLEKRNSITESAIEIPKFSDIKNKDLYRLKVESFLKECYSYKDALTLLESLYAANKFELLETATQRVINDIIPITENVNLNDCISCIELANIGDINKDRLIESAKVYKRADRISANNKKLSKRFGNINLKGKSVREQCFKICEMVDTYNLSKYIKFNIALEEMSLLDYMNGNTMQDCDLVESVTDYFLMLNDNTLDDIASYRSAIESSSVIGYGADSKVKYLMNGYKESSDVFDCLNNWKISANKNISTLIELARNNCENILKLNKIVSTINEYATINELEFDSMDIFKDIKTNINANEAFNIMELLKESKSSNAEEFVDDMRLIWESEVNDAAYNNSPDIPSIESKDINSITLHNLITDAQSTGEFLDQLEKSSMKELPVSIQRLRIEKDESTINESNAADYVDANGYISLKLRSYSFNGFSEAVSQFLDLSTKCANNIIYGRNSTVYYTLSEGRFDFSIRSKYKVMLTEAEELNKGFAASDKYCLCDIDHKTEIIEQLYESSLINIINELTTNPYIAANISAQEASLLFNTLNPYDTGDENGFMHEFVELCRYEANPRYDAIKREYTSIKHEDFNFDDDHETRILIAESVLNMINEISDGGANLAAKGIYNLKKSVGLTKAQQGSNLVADDKDDPKSKLRKEEAKNTTKVDNQQQKNAKPVKKSNNDDDDDEEDEEEKAEKAETNEIKNGIKKDFKKNERKAIESMNDAKLAWQGVKSKLKSASAKEQEMSRDLDMEFNHILHTIKTTYGSDHREEIITGEVNHSLSKVIKIGIGLAGVGVLAHSAVVPIIGAILLFAKSKITTAKEKRLIVDEIDIELQVLDREIQRAEQAGSTKKYRQLLSIQKNLQRKRQELWYGLGKGHKTIPSSTYGLRNRE